MKKGLPFLALMVRSILLTCILLFLTSPVLGNPIFFDDFNGSSLGSDWIIKNPSQDDYSLVNSCLVTKTLPGDLYGNTNDYHNLFLLSNPVGVQDLVITLKVNNFFPNSTFQQIILVAYDNDNNYVRVGNVQGNARVWQIIREQNSIVDAQNAFPNASVSDFYLRLTKYGTTYTQYASLNGINFYQLNSPVTYGEGSPSYLGFVAFQGSGFNQTPVSVSIDYFSVNAVPLPSAILLLGSGILGLGAAGWQRRKKD